MFEVWMLVYTDGQLRDVYINGYDDEIEAYKLAIKLREAIPTQREEIQVYIKNRVVIK